MKMRKNLDFIKCDSESRFITEKNIPFTQLE